MKIFVVGSRRHLVDNSRKTDFQDFCVSLGERIAQEKWQVLAGSVDMDTADYWVLYGMNKAAADPSLQPNASVYRNVPVNVRTFSSIRLHPFIGYRNMTAAHVSAISLADAVVVIGGKKQDARSRLGSIRAEKTHCRSAQVWRCISGDLERSSVRISGYIG